MNKFPFPFSFPFPPLVSGIDTFIELINESFLKICQIIESINIDESKLMLKLVGL